MKQTLIFISLLCSAILNTSAQTNFSMELYAGSNAPWGEGQSLSIDTKGNGKYVLREVNKKGVKDSASFTLSAAQMKQLDDAINTIKFFQLNESYNAKSRDGTRLSVKVTMPGKTHTVHWINIHTSEATQLLDKLNATLKGKGININY